MSESDVGPPEGASANQPTVNLPPEVASGARAADADPPQSQGLRPTALEERLLAEAIKRGLITAAQARTVIESPSGPRRLTDRLVARGLIQEPEARALEEELTRTIVPGFVIERELGRGGMGVVYKARQTRLDRAVALKVVGPEASADLDFLRRFELEAKALGRLNHPHIVQVYDCGEAEGKLFIALEFVDGRDCQKEVEAEGPFPPDKALRVVREAALGLRAAHQSGIIHRDVKPGNILLVRGPDGQLTAKIADLGLALLSSTPAEGRLTQAGTVMGSPAYMAPEQSRAEAADHRSDIYSLGATLYHLLGGETPFTKGGGGVLTILSRKLTVQLDPPRLTTGPIDEPLLRVLDRMLARRPEQRYQTWDEVLADLDALLAGRAPLAPRVEREHSSLRLEAGTTSGAARSSGVAAKGAPTEVRPPSTPAGDSGAPPGGSRAPLLVGGVALLALAGAAFLLGPRSGSGAGTGTGSGAPPVSPPVGLEQLTADEVARGITTLEQLSPAARLADPATVAALASKLATLPAGAQVTWRPRLKAALQGALEATEAARVEELEQAWRAGEWERLLGGTERALAEYATWERQPPTRLRELAGLAEEAALNGAGAAERAAWAAALAAEDPRQRLELLAGFAARFPFSPVLGQAEALRAEAAAAAPELRLTGTPADAALTIDGQPRGPLPWSGRLLRGVHELRAEAPGHVALNLALDLQGDTARELVLGPLPARPLVQDTERGRPLLRANRFLNDWTVERGEWKVVQGGVWGDRAAEGGWTSIRRDVSALLRPLEVDLSGPWQLQWLLTPPAEPGAQAELRSLSAEDGRTVVFGWRGDELYLGLRGPAPSGLTSAGDLDVRAWGRFGPDRPPGFYQLDWDGEVVAARTKQGLLGTLRLPWKPASGCLQLAIREGAATFADLQVFGMREKRP